MIKQVILHDTRLSGIAPAADLNMSVDGTDPLTETFLRIRQYAQAQSRPVDLEILCHGYAAQNDQIRSEARADLPGSTGLQLCREGLHDTTVVTTSKLRGVVNTIVAYVCSAGEAFPSFVGTNKDGQRLFRAMAAYTDATIYAVDATRWYWHLPPVIPNACATVMEFRAFKGYLWRFRPDGSTSIVESNALSAA